MESQPVHSTEVRKYLVDKGIAQLLEKFMADVIESRPDDVLGFLKQWSTEKYAMAVGIADAAIENAPPASEAAAPVAIEESTVVDLRDPLEVVSAAWAAHIQSQQQQQAVVEGFFQMLFLQKPILKKSIFEGVDVADAVQRLTPLVDAAFTGSLRDDVLIEFCKEVAVGKGVEEKHFASFLTALHAAVATKLPTAELENVSVPLNKYLRELAARVQTALVQAEEIAAVESGAEPPASADAHDGSDDEDVQKEKKSETRTAQEIVQDSWGKLPSAQQTSVVKETFDDLFRQHVILAKGPLSDLTVEALVGLVLPILSTVAEGKLTSDAAKRTAFAQEADGRGLQPKHVDYLVTALLRSLSRHFGAQWKTLNDAWTFILSPGATEFKAAAFPSA
ncbi:Hypothetical protein, putative [Bodo saltans]|uniref:Uncharacterized protein n=1 Tax=Bodo saltans TaxID=75058 RepID=A0A0S4J7U7_BODSA|nr:Hypothetical protein, putative [Bodo saltans]|eukprot:CUG61545.1 Hypothetical protein, putative [Bodo saltans]